MSTRIESIFRQLISWSLLISLPGLFLLLSIPAQAAPLGTTSTGEATISLRIPEILQVRGATQSLTKKTSATAASTSFSSPFCISGSPGLQFSVSSDISRANNERALDTAMTGGHYQAYAGSKLVYRAAQHCPKDADSEIVFQLTQSQYTAASNQGSITVTVAAE